MNYRAGTPLSTQLMFLFISGFVFILAGFSASLAFASSEVASRAIDTKPVKNESVLLAQHGGPPEGRRPMHGGRGKHCPGMGHDDGCPGGKGNCSGRKGGCSGGKGMGHRGGMGHGMHQGGGQGGSAQCPQPRTTVKAPKEFYNRTNPVENTPDTVEQGRLLFQLDAQPSCVMCHGSQGDGTGGFGANLSPPPRNFTCKETMKDISDGQLFWIIQNGSPDTGMPPFQDLQDEQIWKLIIFIRSLAQ